MKSAGRENIAIGPEGQGGSAARRALEDGHLLGRARPPPRLDADGAALRAEAPLRAPAPTRSNGSLVAPLAGVRILDLFWILAGPGATRMLAELIENGIEAEKRKQQDFFDLAERFRDETNPEKAKRLGDRLGRMVFGG